MTEPAPTPPTADPSTVALRPFDFAATQAFAGATDFANGDEPLIAEGRLDDGRPWALVVDGSGAGFITADAQAEFGGYRLVRAFGSASDARRWVARRLARINGLTDVFYAGFVAT